MKARVALAALAITGPVAAVACVLADPPPIVTPPPPPPPAIITDSVTPPLFQILHANPPCIDSPTDCFVVPVIADPDQTVQWRVFVDLDPKGSPTQDAIIKQQDDGGVLGVGGEAGSGVRTFSFGIGESSGIDMTQCHTFTFIVAYDFVSNDFSKPAPPGGNSATWFYQPVSDCTLFDAGGLLDGGGD